MTSIAATARATTDRLGLLPEGSPALVMVSGGADSVTLLHLLAEGTLGVRAIRALHIDHLLRGADSDADAAFVRELCGRLGVELRTMRYDVAAYAAEEGLNLEDAGRRIRYRFAEEELDAWCGELGIDPSAGRIAVAHTRDDRAETFFIRALTGAGTGALASIAAQRGRVVRPLIGCDRAAVRAWLAERGGEWREDASNADTERLRAHVRAELIPAAEAVSPAFRTALERTLDLLADDDRLLSAMADAFVRDFAETSADEVAFNREWMATLDRTMARRVVRSALLGAFPEASRLEALHIEALVDGLAEDGFARDLPEGLRAFAEYDKMIVSRISSKPPRVAPALLPVPGMVELGPCGRIIADLVEPDRRGEAQRVVVDVGDACELVVDGARAGDRMKPLGMEGSRKLSDLLIDEKVPARRRCAVPVVRLGERIVWVAGVRMSEEFKVAEATTRAVRLTWEPGDAEQG